MVVKQNCGRTEEDANIAKVLRQLADCYDQGDGFVVAANEMGETYTDVLAYIRQCPHKDGLVVRFMPESKNHNGKPMMLIGNFADVSTICLEISEEGMFAYYVDDGVS